MNVKDSVIEKRASTPLMKQYFSIKEQYPNSLLLFQVGDFYELFFEDAIQAAQTLHIALTKRGHINGEPIPLCGVPLHALNAYLAKLVKAGHHVVIVDQLSEPVPGRVVERGVTQVLTPGTLIDDQLLDDKSASYIMSCAVTQESWGLLFAELLTGQVFMSVISAGDFKQLDAHIVRFFPDEIILVSHAPQELKNFFKQLAYPISFLEKDILDSFAQAMNEWLASFLQPQKKEIITSHESLLGASLQFFAYMNQTNMHVLETIKSIQVYKKDDFLVFDGATVANLELIKNNYDGTRSHSLLSILDGAITSMGSRMIKKWLLRPLAQKSAIEKRQQAITILKNDAVGMQELGALLKQISDVERMVGRIALRRGHVKDYQALHKSLEMVDLIKQLFLQKKSWTRQEMMGTIYAQLGSFEELHELLTLSLNDDESRDWIIKSGFDAELDRLRLLIDNSQEEILALEEREIKKTGISSLKIRYNNVQGYYFEITKTHLAKVPDYFIRVASLTNRERFTTQELKVLEHDINRAQTEVKNVERIVFERVKRITSQYISSLRQCAYALGTLDALLGLARIAYEYGYVCPEITTDGDLVIENGRHPVVERTLASNSFIPNDIFLNRQERVWIITGPNMGGKSTYLRQIALITIMAHIGSYVPAQAARICVLDKLFTRIGASDNVSHGKSTFLVEMEETALICQEATERSLVILDEVGRGTSTFDGVAIAQAVIEFITHTAQAKCLFATHYHELTALTDIYSSISCYFAASKQTDEGIIFLHKIIKGVADGSFGLEVARLASLSPVIIDRAREILNQLHHDSEEKYIPASKSYENADNNIILDEEYHRLKQENNYLKTRISRIEKISLDDISPRDAWELLKSLQSD
ncbi:MAG TPA: DNA mismatch repair protein MutS [Candidatus Babeliales bacterium]|nr:DNA mismatch repair protein MutS [Candidatus Babeliales bacterium]